MSLVRLLVTLAVASGCRSFGTPRFADTTGVDMVPPSFAVQRRAQTAAPPTPDDEHLRANARRLEYLTRAIEADWVIASRWQWGWILGFSGLVVGNVVRAIVFDGGGRDAGIVGAFGSAIGLTSLFVTPARALRGRTEMRVIARRPGPVSDVDVEHAEEVLRATAQAEESFSAPVLQFGRAGVAVLLGVTLAFGFQRLDAAAFNLGAGLVIGQVMRATHPTAASEALREYQRALADGVFRRAGAGPLRVPRGEPRIQIVPVLGIAGAPVGIGGVF